MFTEGASVAAEFPRHRPRVRIPTIAYLSQGRLPIPDLSSWNFLIGLVWLLSLAFLRTGIATWCAGDADASEFSPDR